MDKLSSKQREWLDHVEACAAVGGSMKAYAEEHGLDLQSFYLWRGRLKKLGLVAVPAERHRQATAIVPAPLRAAPGTAKAHTRIELANGIAIEAPRDIEADTLCDVLRHALALDP